MDEFDKFYNKALYFLSYRPRSEKEVSDYLRKKKVNELTSARIMQKLMENNFINDKEFTTWFIEQRTVIRPKAQRIVKMELIQKGIDRDLIDELLLKTTNSDLENAKNLAEKRIKRYSNLEDKSKIYEKMFRFLASKGFNYDTIKQVIDQILTKEYN